MAMRHRSYQYIGGRQRRYGLDECISRENVGCIEHPHAVCTMTTVKDGLARKRALVLALELHVIIDS